ncbi:MAG: Gfo/Idh/MocA family oxidoreductase, partial [Chloroflexi bacterium]|nr:Gfo/Idh/MocA family oxidoreductase [Chloroflexota bacterium]
MINVGIVGMGGMGWFHASKYFLLPNVKIAAIADLSPDRLEAKNAVQINIDGDQRPVDFSTVARYGDAGDLIAQADVDVVDVCLPTDVHARYAIQALQQGRHVLCEKPMALTLEDAGAMVDAARTANRRLMIAQCIRFWPEYRFLRDCVQDGRYGKLLSLSLTRVGGQPGWSSRNWFLDPVRSGGPIHDLHIHDVDFVNYLLGKPGT